MTPTTTIPSPQWQSAEWFGNPALGMDAAVKKFVNPYNGRRVSVWVYGTSEFHFCVSAGANSEWSYTGFCKDVVSIEEAREYVDRLYSEGRLFR